MKKIILATLILFGLIFFMTNYSKPDEAYADIIEPTVTPTPVATETPTPTPIPTPTEVEILPDVVEEPKYTEEELDILARIIWCEAGSDWLSDEHQQAIASVVINRKNDSRFPNTIKGVIYQQGQYACVGNGMINQTPNQRAYDNAKYVLENGITIPDNVVWQAQFRQGRGVYKYIEGHYFCY